MIFFSRIKTVTDDKRLKTEMIFSFSYRWLNGPPGTDPIKARFDVTGLGTVHGGGESGRVVPPPS